MYANELKQLTARARNNLTSKNDLYWALFKKSVYTQATDLAIQGKDSLTLDLSGQEFSEFIDDNLSLIKERFEAEGLKVYYSLERSPYGKRELIITWKNESN